MFIVVTHIHPACLSKGVVQVVVCMRWPDVDSIEDGLDCCRVKTGGGACGNSSGGKQKRLSQLVTVRVYD